MGSYESLKRLKGKIGEPPFFKVQSGKVTVWVPHLSTMLAYVTDKQICKLLHNHILRTNIF